LIGLFVLMLALMRLYVEPALQGAKQTLTPEICWPESRSRSGRAGEDLLVGIGAMVLALLMFWLSTKLLVTSPIPVSTYLNRAPEGFAEVVSSCRHWLVVMLDGLASGSRVFAVLPLLFVLIGFALMLWRALKQDWQLGLLTAVVLLLIPLALHLTWILNRLTPLYGGRFVPAYAYLLFWCYFVLASQMIQAIQIKTVYALGFINRFVTRIEPLLVGDPDKPQPVVVFGHYPKFTLHNDVSWPIEVKLSQLLSTNAFTEFRQVDILHAALGRRAMRPPVPAESEQTRRAASLVQPWPGSGAVFREGRSVVIVLEPDAPGRSVTVPQGN